MTTYWSTISSGTGSVSCRLWQKMALRLLADRDRYGFGFWAVQVRASGEFVGFAGLDTVDDEMPFTGIELGWRLARSAWGHGYATEAALAALRYGFEVMGLPEIVAVTMALNLRSRAVMGRIGMTSDPAEDFDDPDVDEIPLRRHVVYRKLRDPQHDRHRGSRPRMVMPA